MELQIKNQQTISKYDYQFNTRELLDVLTNIHNKFDLLVYVVECKECLRKASAQEYFNKTM